MKQKYITPETCIVHIHSQHHLLSGSAMGIGGEANSSTVVESRRRGIWDDDIWDEEE